MPYAAIRGVHPALPSGKWDGRLCAKNQSLLAPRTGSCLSLLLLTPLVPGFWHTEVQYSPVNSVECRLNDSRNHQPGTLLLMPTRGPRTRCGSLAPLPPNLLAGRTTTQHGCRSTGPYFFSFLGFCRCLAVFCCLSSGECRPGKITRVYLASFSGRASIVFRTSSDHSPADAP